ncbi:hypothetical protein C7974DRAFT_17150 [Boeremia exigua]|uniref:uncharacterized protein n=1 Tax=Boeremia exigua TaxID=749465 RepID=UPI001E8CC798|nr:uncharacterized protein C7974DRAFT_17150 [Boeremia exigua]KAH6644222.1 hypothetical protein C7974DRAFT_17150 [Boeremia exigua]
MNSVNLSKLHRRRAAERALLALLVAVHLRAIWADADTRASGELSRVTPLNTTLSSIIRLVLFTLLLLITRYQNIVV